MEDNSLGLASENIFPYFHVVWRVVCGIDNPYFIYGNDVTILTPRSWTVH